MADQATGNSPASRLDTSQPETSANEKDNIESVEVDNNSSAASSAAEVQRRPRKRRHTETEPRTQLNRNELSQQRQDTLIQFLQSYGSRRAIREQVVCLKSNDPAFRLLELPQDQIADAFVQYEQQRVNRPTAVDMYVFGCILQGPEDLRSDVREKTVLREAKRDNAKAAKDRVYNRHACYRKFYELCMRLCDQDDTCAVILTLQPTIKRYAHDLNLNCISMLPTLIQHVPDE
jgi:hypothetical protein